MPKYAIVELNDVVDRERERLEKSDTIIGSSQLLQMHAETIVSLSRVNDPSNLKFYQVTRELVELDIIERSKK